MIESPFRAVHIYELGGSLDFRTHVRTKVHAHLPPPPPPPAPTPPHVVRNIRHMLSGRFSSSYMIKTKVDFVKIIKLFTELFVQL